MELQINRTIKYLSITLIGVICNLLVYAYNKRNQYNLNLIVSNTILFAILPTSIIVILIIIIVRNYQKRKRFTDWTMLLISIFLLLIIMQFLIFWNDVLVK
jgi:hypothetical protein